MDCAFASSLFRLLEEKFICFGYVDYDELFVGSAVFAIAVVI